MLSKRECPAPPRPAQRAQRVLHRARGAQRRAVATSATEVIGDFPEEPCRDTRVVLQAHWVTKVGGEWWRVRWGGGAWTTERPGSPAEQGSAFLLPTLGACLASGYSGNAARFGVSLAGTSSPGMN